MKKIKSQLATLLVGCISIGMILATIVLFFKGQDGGSLVTLCGAGMTSGIFNVLR